LENRKGAHLADPGAELLDGVTRFWDRYGRLTLGAIAVAAVVSVGLFATLRARASQEELASGKLAEANVLFWQGDYQRSLQLAKQVSQQFGSTPSGNDAHRLAGDNAYWSGDFKTAISEYRAFLAKQKSGVIADATRRSLAYALESDLKFAEAAALYDQLVGVFDRESSAEFLMASARCHLQMKQPAEALKRLQRLADEFGESSVAMRARQEIGEIQGAQ
jgi:tetratricopeptide (TPR) repeat protein